MFRGRINSILFKRKSTSKNNYINIPITEIEDVDSIENTFAKVNDYISAHPRTTEPAILKNELFLHVFGNDYLIKYPVHDHYLYQYHMVNNIVKRATFIMHSNMIDINNYIRFHDISNSNTESIKNGYKIQNYRWNHKYDNIKQKKLDDIEAMLRKDMSKRRKRKHHKTSRK